MKIAHLVHGYPPDHEGGTERYVRALGEAQAKAGAEIVVLAGSMQPKPQPLVLEREVGGLRVLFLHRSGRFLEAWHRIDGPELYDLVRATLAEEAPDLVHIHHWQRLGRRLVQAADSLGIPAVVTCHDAWTGCPRAFRVREGSLCERPVGPASCTDCVPGAPELGREELCGEIALHVDEHREELRLARAVIVPGEWHKRLLERGDPGQLPREICVLPHGTIAPLSLAPAIPRTRATEPLRLAHWGHLSQAKGTALLLEALRLLPLESRARIRVDAFGTASDPAEARAFQGASFELLVQWHGAFRPEDLSGRAIDWAVFPSIAPESHSFVLDEAFRLRVPAIVPARGAFAERIGRAGLCFAPEDPSDLSRVLADLIEDTAVAAEARASIPDLLEMDAHARDLLQRYAYWIESPAREALPDGGGLARRRRMQLARRRAALECWADELAEANDQQKARLERLEPGLIAASEALESAADEREQFVLSINNFESLLAAERARAEALQDLAATRAKERDAVHADRDRWQREAERLALLHADSEQRREREARLLEADRDRWHKEATALSADRDRWQQLSHAARRDADDQIRAIRAREQRVEADLSAAQLREQSARAAERLAEKARSEAEAVAAASQRLALAVQADLSTRKDEILALQEALAISENEVLSLRTRLEAAADAEAFARRERAARELLELRLRRMEERLHALLKGTDPSDRLEDLIQRLTARTEEATAERLRALNRLKDARAAEASARHSEESLRRALAEEDRARQARARHPIQRWFEPKRRQPETLRRPLTLFVVHQFLPRHLAGTEIYTFRLARELSAEGGVLIFTTEAHPGRHSYSVTERNVQGLPVIEVSHQHTTRYLERLDFDPLMEAIFKDTLARYRPDVVHIQHLAHHSLGYPRLAKEAGAKVIYTLHEYLLLCLRHGQMRRENGERCLLPVPKLCADCIAERGLLIGPADPYEGLPEQKRPSDEDAFIPFGQDPGSAREQAVLDRLQKIESALQPVDLFLAPSAFLKERFVQSGLIAEERIEVSPNGQDHRPFAALARQPSKALRVGYIGTIAEYKGVHVLLEAVDRLVGRPDLELHIHGSLESFPDYAEGLRQRVIHPNVHFHGRYEPAAIGAVLADLDVLVVPSLWYENAPLTIQEAFLAGLPVIASDLGGMREAVEDGISGRLFPPGDALQLSAILLELLERRDLLQSYARNLPAVRSIEADAARMRQRYEELFL